MKTARDTAILRGNLQETKGPITTSGLVRSAGVAAMGAGLLYVAIQVIHPLDVFGSVTTPRWAITHYVSMIMDLLAIFGLVGIYGRQAERAGRLGLAGYLVFSLFWVFILPFHFVEAVIYPVLASESPKFVQGMIGLVTGAPSEINLGALSTIYSLTGLVGYLIGGALFGIATFRAGVLPRWSGGLLAIGTVLPLLGSSFVHHPYDRIFAVPVGLAVAWMGYAVFSQRTRDAETERETASAERRQAAVTSGVR